MCHRPCTILTCIEIFTLHVYHLTTLGGGGSDGGWWVTALQVCVSKFVSVALLDLPKAKSGHFPNTFAATETGHISWEVRLSPSMAGDPGTIFNPNRVIFRGGRAICSHTCGKKQVFYRRPGDISSRVRGDRTVQETWGYFNCDCGHQNKYFQTKHDVFLTSTNYVFFAHTTTEDKRSIVIEIEPFLDQFHNRNILKSDSVNCDWIISNSNMNTFKCVSNLVTQFFRPFNTTDVRLSQTSDALFCHH